MTLQELHERTGISKRRLRYCLDHQLVPGLNIELAANEVGRPRMFHEDIGFGIVCAARLLELGLPHERIRHFLGSLLQITVGDPKTGHLAIAVILEKNLLAIAYLGDGVNVRLVVKEPEGLEAWDSGWIAPGEQAKLTNEYRPMVEVVLDLGHIHRQILGTDETDP